MHLFVAEDSSSSSRLKQALAMHQLMEIRILSSPENRVKVQARPPEMCVSL